MRIGKRQLEELARRAAAYVEAFYLLAGDQPGPPRWLLVLTFDGKGIVMLPEALRPATAKAAAAAQGKLATGPVALARRTAASGWPSWPAFTTPPRSRAPPGTSSAPPREEKEEPSAGRQAEGQAEAAGATGAGKMADRLGHRRHPRRHRRRLRRRQNAATCSTSGNGSSLLTEHADRDAATEAASRGITVTVVIDFIHVLEYLWKAAWSFFDKGVRPRNGLLTRHQDSSRGKPVQVAAGSAAGPPPTGTPLAERAGADECARYLDNKDDLCYATALEKGWPIATGVIEGAARWLVKDRMDITGARWGLQGAEAILKLRALIASGDFDAYWRFHLRREHERIHHARYRDELSSQRNQLTSKEPHPSQMPPQRQSWRSRSVVGHGPPRPRPATVQRLPPIFGISEIILPPRMALCSLP